MKTLFSLTLGALALCSLCSCSCDCKSYNPDYLRDVPVTHSQRFE